MRIKPYVWDIVLALGIFWLYLELKNIQLVQNEEANLWGDYYRRKDAAAKAAAAKTTQAPASSFFGVDLSGVGNFLGNLWDPLKGKQGVLG
jgi:hypothetical protein